MQNFKSRGVAALFAALLASHSLLAQTDEADTGTEDPTSQTENSEQTESATDFDDQSPQNEEINPDASFTPTEEISEDKPVAFPVDI